MATQQQLTPEAATRIANIEYTVSGVSLVGAIAGAVYSSRKGGGFWKGVLWFIGGGIVAGVAAHLVALSFENRIIKEGVTNVEVAEPLTLAQQIQKDLDAQKTKMSMQELDDYQKMLDDDMGI